MHDDDFTSEGRVLGGLLVAFFLVTVLAGVDVASDLRYGTTLQHVLAEVGVVVVGLVGSAFIGRQLLVGFRRARATEAELRALAGRLKATEAEAARWRAEAADLIAGLGSAIDQQFERWSLSPAGERSRAAVAQRVEPQGAGRGSVGYRGDCEAAGEGGVQKGGVVRQKRLGGVLP